MFSVRIKKCLVFLSLLVISLAVFLFGKNAALSAAWSWQVLTKVYIWNLAVFTVSACMTLFVMHRLTGVIAFVACTVLYVLFLGNITEFFSNIAMKNVNATDLLISHGAKLL